MSELIVDRIITSIPNDEPTLDEIKDEQLEKNILEVKKLDELELDEIKETTQIFKKPMINAQPKKKKKVLSQRQIEHLKKMRERKAEKAKLKKISTKLKPKKEVTQQKVVQQEVVRPISEKPTMNATTQPNNFNFDHFLGNVDKMINVLNKWNNMRQPQQIQRQIQKPTPTKVVKIPKKVKSIPVEQPSTMDFFSNINCRDNFRRPFE